MGRGYSFEALRAKILFTEGAHVVKSRPKFERRRNERVMFSIPVDADVCMDSFAMSRFSLGSETKFQHDTPEETLNFGSDIPTLVRLIEEGKL